MRTALLQWWTAVAQVMAPALAAAQVQQGSSQQLARAGKES